MPVAFHALALVYIVRGTMALRGALQAAKERAAEPPVVNEVVDGAASEANSSVASK